MTSIPIAPHAPASAVTGEFWRARVASLRETSGRNLLGIRGLSLSRLAWAIVFVALFTLWSTLGGLLAGNRPNFCLGGASGCLLYWFPIYSIWILPQVVAFTLADNLPLRGIPRFAAFAAAIALATLSFPVLACAIPLPDFTTRCDDFPSLTTFGEFTGQMTAPAYFASIIVATALARRHDQEVAAALHASQLGRIDAYRIALEAELHVMQARVEPAFLFGALGDIAEHYERDRRDGERLLDELIKYLRAALPDMRAEGSTVAKECRLLRAYLNVLALRSRGSLAVDIRPTTGIDDVRMPPMLLVPLLAPAAGDAAPMPEHGGSIRIDIRAIHGRVRIALEVSGAVARSIVTPAAVTEVRERLAALYGESASLAVDRSPADRVELILELPR